MRALFFTYTIQVMVGVFGFLLWLLAGDFGWMICFRWRFVGGWCGEGRWVKGGMGMGWRCIRSGGGVS